MHAIQKCLYPYQHTWSIQPWKQFKSMLNNFFCIRWGTFHFLRDVSNFGMFVGYHDLFLFTRVQVWPLTKFYSYCFWYAGGDRGGGPRTRLKQLVVFLPKIHCVTEIDICKKQTEYIRVSDQTCWNLNAIDRCFVSFQSWPTVRWFACAIK